MCACARARLSAIVKNGGISGNRSADGLFPALFLTSGGGSLNEKARRSVLRRSRMGGARARGVLSRG